MRPQRVLFIRRDNIGDLVCTTPLFTALRNRYPEAHIALLANTYCAPVVAHNPDIDQMYVYAKAKHLPPAQRPGAYWTRIRLIQEMRRARFDHIILAAASYYSRGLEFARWLPGAKVIGFSSDEGRTHGLDVAIPRGKHDHHEVEDLFQLLAPLDISGSPPPTRVSAQPEATAHIRSLLPNHFRDKAPIAIHISARHPSNRWYPERYIALIKSLISDGHNILLLWAPGKPNNPTHPGDDPAADEISQTIANDHIFCLPTTELQLLIAGLEVSRGAILSDGGAMHIAAALKKPLVCFFGDTNAARWRPWRSPHILLQPDSRTVKDISATEAYQAAKRLFSSTSTGIIMGSNP